MTMSKMFKEYRECSAALQVAISKMRGSSAALKFRKECIKSTQQITNTNFVGEWQQNDLEAAAQNYYFSLGNIRHAVRKMREIEDALAYCC